MGAGFVYDFTEGSRDMKDLLGGKGANLAEMTNLGLPVPPGFTITTEACNVYLDSGDEPAELRDEVSTHLAALEKTMGRDLGQPVGHVAHLEVGPAGRGRDREPGRHRETQVGHLGEVRPLAAEQVLLALVALAEVEDPLRLRGSIGLAGHR